MPESFEAFYATTLQGTWLQLPVPALFLAYLASAGRTRVAACARPRADFILAYCAFFTVETLLDPVLGGPVSQWLGLSPAAQSALIFFFVWLGDFRVTLLVFELGDARRPWLQAAAWACAVPLVDLLLFFGLLRGLWPDTPGQVLWLVHETAFLMLALWMRAVLVPRLTLEEPAGQRAFLRRALAYVAVYYALWASADVLILAGLDLGWALRLIPNQLYYAFWTAFVFFSFTARRAAGAASSGGRA